MTYVFTVVSTLHRTDHDLLVAYNTPMTARTSRADIHVDINSLARLSKRPTVKSILSSCHARDLMLQEVCFVYIQGLVYITARLALEMRGYHFSLSHLVRIRRYPLPWRKIGYPIYVTTSRISVYISERVPLFKLGESDLPCLVYKHGGHIYRKM